MSRAFAFIAIVGVVTVLCGAPYEVLLVFLLVSVCMIGGLLSERLPTKPTDTSTASAAAPKSDFEQKIINILRGK